MNAFAEPRANTSVQRIISSYKRSTPHMVQQQENKALEDGSDKDIFGWAPISQLMGLEVQPGEAGEAIIYLNVDQRMHNPMGFVHGGVISLLADAAMGIAFGRTLADQEAFATVEMKVSYMRPVKETRLTAKADLVQRGLRIGFVECEIRDHRSRRIAQASCTCTINSLD